MAGDEYVTIVTLEQLADGTSTYFAYHPELPGCMSDGESIEEARRNLAAATEVCLEHLRASALAVPRPMLLFGELRKPPEIVNRIGDDVKCAPRDELVLA